MGTNFYLFTKDKEFKEKYFGSRAEIVDTPEFGYQLHIAKTSAGWLPLFESSELIKSVHDITNAILGGARVIDEYGDEYTMDEFTKRVLMWNGGTRANRSVKHYKQDTDSPYFDKNMPDFIPVSHFEYAGGWYRNEFYTDRDGYEFTNKEFS